MSHSNEVKYPQNCEEWQLWLEYHLGIDSRKGALLVQEEKFPVGKLIGLWEEKFSAENGYSPSFIPALVRNKIGFLRWVYGNAPEPNWSKSDDSL